MVESEAGEIAELRTRLAEAELVLDAICSGAADAFMGQTGGVFHLSGSERPYVTFFDAMNEGGVTLDSSGQILHGNPRFVAMMGRPLEELRGISLLSCVVVADQDCMRQILASKAPAACEVWLDAAGQALPVRVSVTTTDTGVQSFSCMVITDLTTAKQAEAAIRDSEESLRAMYANLQTVTEAERKRVAREVHDELGQVLTALRMEVLMLQREVSEQPRPLSRIEEIRSLIEEMFKTVRSIAGNLRPATLDLGLVPAIEWLAERFEERWKIDCALDIDPRDIRASDSYATAVFRIIQESLTNVARHAHASSVSISLQQTQMGLQLEIRDNGCGFVPDKAKGGGFGMVGIRERVLELGGVLNVRSAPDKGTGIYIELPLAVVK